MDSEEPTCYICYEPATTEKPFCKANHCLCKGSLSIHTQCLIELRKHATKCTVCKSNFAEKTPGEYILLGREGNLRKVSYINKEYYNYVYTINSDGLSHGEFKIYYPSGRLRAIQNYIYGELFGEARTYYDNEANSLLGIANYMGNLKNGLLKSYTEDARLHKEFNYKSDVPHGLCNEYKFDGGLYKTFNYVNGVLHGECTIYYIGNLQKKLIYNNGVLESTKIYHNGIMRKLLGSIKNMIKN